MHFLTAEVPDAGVRRSDVVPCRLARNLAPLFGVRGPGSPFHRTWVCDFSTLTLAEIARGAPLPSREEQLALDGKDQAGLPVTGPAVPDDRRPPVPARRADNEPSWQFSGRAVWTYRRGPVPDAITHATLNRYGPDTKSAVVLTGANRLLQDITLAVGDVCRHLARCRISPEHRLAVWAGLVLEAYRGQPALITAAIQARTVQRALTATWHQPVVVPPGMASARSEIQPPVAAGSPSARHRDRYCPTSFDLIDMTLPLLDLSLPVDGGPPISRTDLLDDVAGRWCRRLLQIGSPGRGIVWITDSPGGHRSVETYVRAGSLIAPFTAEVLAVGAVAAQGGVPVPATELWPLPARSELEGMTVLARRAHLISRHALADFIRFHDDRLRENGDLRTATRQAVAAAGRAARHHLGACDPTASLLDGYFRYCEVADACATSALALDQLAVSTAALFGQQDDLVTAWRRGDLDPGTASYLLEIGAMTLGRATTVLGQFRGCVPTLAGYWRQLMLARGIDVRRDLADPVAVPAPQRYHLQNYADFHAAAAEAPDQVRSALVMQRACLGVRDQVARGEFADYPAKFTSTRTGHLVMVAIVRRLLTLTGGPDGQLDQDVLAEGLTHASSVLADATVRMLLSVRPADPELTRIADVLLPLFAGQQALTTADPVLKADVQLLRQAMATA